MIASPVVRAHEWYPRACCGGEDCGPADIVHAGETDWDRQLRAFDDHLMGLYAADKAAPASPYMPMLPPEQMRSSMPVYQPEDVWDMNNRWLSKPRTRSRGSDTSGSVWTLCRVGRASVGAGQDRQCAKLNWLYEPAVPPTFKEPKRDAAFHRFDARPASTRSWSLRSAVRSRYKPDLRLSDLAFGWPERFYCLEPPLRACRRTFVL